MPCFLLRANLIRRETAAAGAALVGVTGEEGLEEARARRTDRGCGELHGRLVVRRCAGSGRYASGTVGGCGEAGEEA
jgi:hypothetical protein